jgi:ferredoxin
MADKGLIRGKRKGYALIPLLPGMFENVLLSSTESEWYRDFARHLHDLFETGYIRRHFQQPTHLARAIPVDESISKASIRINFDHMEKIIDSHQLMGILHNCQCRESKHLLGEDCQKADRRDGCLVFGRFAKIFIQRGSAEAVSRERMREVVRDRWDKKLTFFGGNVSPGSPNLVCTCCDCCCHMLGHIINPDPSSIITPPPFLVSVSEENCIRCGKCVSVCNLFAHDIKNGRHIFDQSRCVGCGLCVKECPAGAITVTENRKYRKPYAGILQLGLRIIPSKIMGMVMTNLRQNKGTERRNVSTK